jgi:hypothetical protein
VDYEYGSLGHVLCDAGLLHESINV